MIGISSSWVQSILRAILQPETRELVTMSKEVQASVVLQCDRPEFSLPGGEFLVGGIVQFNPLAANTASARIRNPAASGVLGIVERIPVTVSVASRVNVNVMKGNLDLGTLFNTKTPRDVRVAPNAGFLPFGTLILSGAQPSGANGAANASAFLAANTPYVFVGPWILGPGDSLEIEHTTVNLDFTVSPVWRERQLIGSRVLA